MLNTINHSKPACWCVVVFFNRRFALSHRIESNSFGCSCVLFVFWHIYIYMVDKTVSVFVFVWECVFVMKRKKHFFCRFIYRECLCRCFSPCSPATFRSIVSSDCFEFLFSPFFPAWNNSSFFSLGMQSGFICVWAVFFFEIKFFISV